MLPVEEVSGLLHLTPDELRSFIVHYNIPLYHDPVFGELMTINGLRAVQRGTYAERRTARYDTQAMLLFLTKQDGITWNPRNHSYWMQLDAEIRRICALPEPDRTMRAVTLWTAWRDAKQFRECLAKYRARYLKAVDTTKSAKRAKVDRGMDTLEQGINGTIGGRMKIWRLPPVDKSQIQVKKVKEKIAPSILKEIREMNRERKLQEKLAALPPEAPWWAAKAIKYHHERGR